MSFFYIYKFVPETHQKTLEEIERFFALDPLMHPEGSSALLCLPACPGDAAAGGRALLLLRFFISLLMCGGGGCACLWSVWCDVREHMRLLAVYDWGGGRCRPPSATTRTRRRVVAAMRCPLTRPTPYRHRRRRGTAREGG